MFSQTAEYALRVVVHLASLEGKAATMRQIAKATVIPEGYLAKVIQGLGRARLVLSQRGLYGGSILARAPDEITVYDVIESVSPLPRIRTCPLGLKSHGTKLCALHRQLDDAMETVETAFRKSKISDILEASSVNVPLCEVNSTGSKRAAFSRPVAMNASRKR
jgi:Rrf2 family protein